MEPMELGKVPVPSVALLLRHLRFVVPGLPWPGPGSSHLDGYGCHQMDIGQQRSIIFLGHHDQQIWMVHDENF